jgi:hypothetical protein
VLREVLGSEWDRSGDGLSDELTGGSNFPIFTMFGRLMALQCDPSLSPDTPRTVSLNRGAISSPGMSKHRKNAVCDR